MALHWIAANPFNTLGLLAGVSDKELARRKAQFNAYLNVGKEVQFPEDLPAEYSGTIRTPEAVAQAFAALDKYSDRALHGLFWFSEAGRVDGPALAHLRAGDLQKAKDIWSRVVNAGALTAQTLSSATNHGALCFLEAGSRNGSAASLYIEGLGSYFKAFAHKEFPAHVARIADETVTKNMPDLLQSWFQLFRSGVAGSIKVDAAFLSSVATAIKTLPKDMGDVLSHAFASEHAAEVDRMVSSCCAKRKSDPAKSLGQGSTLLAAGSGHLRSLKAILGSGNVEVQQASDHFAEELLNCAIDHYNQNEENGVVDWAQLRKLMDAAVIYAQGQRLKARVTDNKKTLDGNFDNREQHAKDQRVQPLIAQIERALQMAGRTGTDEWASATDNSSFFGRSPIVRTPTRPPDLIDKADALLTHCNLLLKQLRAEMGGGDEIYLNVSSAVANKALQLIIKNVNEIDSRSFETMPILVVGRAKPLMDRLSLLDMVPPLRNNVEANAKTLDEMHRKLFDPTPLVRPIRATSPSDNSGLLITVAIIVVVILLAVYFG